MRSSKGLDYFTWLPFFVIAGATVAPKIRVHGDHTHFEGATIDVPGREIGVLLRWRSRTCSARPPRRTTPPKPASRSPARQERYLILIR